MRYDTKVLVVDDSLSMCKYVESILESEFGVRDVTLASSADDALRCLEKKKIDFIYTDYEMPGMDVTAFFSLLRSRPETADIPIVILTGREEQYASKIALHTRAHDYLTKPFTPELLVNKTMRIMRLRERRGAARVIPHVTCEMDIGFDDYLVHAVDLLNISTTGCLVRTSMPRHGAAVIYDIGTIRMQYFGVKDIHLHGQIVRIESDGMISDFQRNIRIAFEFKNMDKKTSTQLQDYIDLCEAVTTTLKAADDDAVA